VSFAVEILTLTLTRGSLYAVVGLGFALVFGAGRVLNLFHGSFFLLGAYAAFVLTSITDARGYAGKTLLLMVVAALIVAVIGYVYYRLLLRPFHGNQLRMMVAGMAANLVVAEAVRALYGARAASVPSVIPGSLMIGSVAVLWQEALLVLAALLATGSLLWFLSHSQTGLAIRAVAQDPEAAELIGIVPVHALGSSVAVAALLAGLAGALAAPARVIGPDMWTFALLVSFAVVVVGGVGSLVGTLVVSYVLAAVEIVTGVLLNTAAAETVALAAIVVFLLIRPRGFFDVSAR
jgi:branched-chain amino acid transport system permease protein